MRLFSNALKFVSDFLNEVFDWILSRANMYLDTIWIVAIDYIGVIADCRIITPLSSNFWTAACWIIVVIINQYFPFFLIKYPIDPGSFIQWISGIILQQIFSVRACCVCAQVRERRFFVNWGADKIFEIFTWLFMAQNVRRAYKSIV